MKEFIGTLLVVFIFIICQDLPINAQAKNCNLKLSVFLKQNNEKPLSQEITKTEATLVRLSDNKLLSGDIFNNTITFKNLSKGNYNAVAFKSGYKKTSKQISLDCDFTDKNNFYNELVFLEEGNSNETNSMMNSILVLSLPSPTLPNLQGSSVKSEAKNAVKVNVVGGLNERAVYLPTPLVTSEGEKWLKKIKQYSVEEVIVEVNIVVDENGTVVSADYAEDNPQHLNYFPDVLDKARQSRFLPIYVNGKPVVFAGTITYGRFLPNQSNISSSL